MTREQIEAAARECVDHRVEFSGEDESPNISSSIDKELRQAFIHGAKWMQEQLEGSILRLERQAFEAAKELEETDSLEGIKYKNPTFEDWKEQGK